MSNCQLKLSITPFQCLLRRVVQCSAVKCLLEITALRAQSQPGNKQKIGSKFPVSTCQALIIDTWDLEFQSRQWFYGTLKAVHEQRLVLSFLSLLVAMFGPRIKPLGPYSLFIPCSDKLMVIFYMVPVRERVWGSVSIILVMTPHILLLRPIDSWETQGSSEGAWLASEW